MFVTGATGLVGRRLCASLAARGDSVLALSRGGPPPGGSGGASLRWLRGDPNSDGDWLEELAACDVVVHLAGEPIAAGRWTRQRKQRLVDSRVATTARIVTALRAAKSRPATLLCASACGFYGPRGEELLDEASSPGSDFLSQLCVQWEAAAGEAGGFGVRVVNLRFGIVLSRDGGALAPMLRAFRLFAGGPLGPPERYFPWIHESDAVKAMELAIDRDISGPLNLVSPEPTTMGEFARALGAVLRRPSWLPLPETLLGVVLGELGESLIPGQRVLPRVAQQAGLEFEHPRAAEALAACVG